jgi:hypothetical protein
MDKKTLIRKWLVVGIVFLFIGITVQSSYASEISSSKTSDENKDNSRDSEFVYILCFAYYNF